MTCKKCEKTVEFPNLPHILRKCTGCGRELRVRVPSVQAEGLRVQEGESLVIPAGFLSVSPNPLKSSGYFTRIGMQRYTEALFFGGITAERSSVMSEIERFDGECRDLLKGTDLEAACRGESDDAVLKEVMDRTKDSVQWWAFLAACFCATFSDALEEGDPSAIAWPVAGIERARSMILYKNSFEEVVFMGQSARKVIDIIYT